MSGNDVYRWCQDRLQPIGELVADFEAHRTDRDARAPITDNTEFIRISGEIVSQLKTLRYVRKERSVLQEIKDLAADMRTPEHGYFGPAPSIGEAAGVGAAFGAAADMSGALLAIFKEARADKKLRKEVRSDPSRIKGQIKQDYCRLVILLHEMVRLGAEKETFATGLYKGGLNVPILDKSWSMMNQYKWVVLSG